MTSKSWMLAGASLLAAAIAAVGVVVMSGGQEPALVAQNVGPNTEEVEKGDLSSIVSLDGTLTYRARPDGSPYTVINQAKGTYTRLPEAGDKVDCGDEFYRVDDDPVLLLCGEIPTYRNLSIGSVGGDVRQLNRNLRRLGYHGVDPHDDGFTWETENALSELQRANDLEETGTLDTADVVVLPRAARVSKVIGKLGGSAHAGSPVAQATSDTLDVQVDLEASQQGQVKRGDRVSIILPDNTSATGRVDRLGRVARTRNGNAQGAGATIPAYIGLDHPAKSRGLDQAPVQVEIRTKGVENALSVPVTALVGRSGGGFAVELVRDGGQRALVAVKLGLFDTAGGRVQVEGDLAVGDHVVVPLP